MGGPSAGEEAADRELAVQPRGVCIWNVGHRL